MRPMITINCPGVRPESLSRTEIGTIGGRSPRWRSTREVRHTTVAEAEDPDFDPPTIVRGAD